MASRLENRHGYALITRGIMRKQKEFKTKKKIIEEQGKQEVVKA